MIRLNNRGVGSSKMPLEITGLGAKFQIHSNGALLIFELSSPIEYSRPSRILRVVPLSLALITFLAGQSWTVLESSTANLTLSIENPAPGESYYLEELRWRIGLPEKSLPRIVVTSIESRPFSESPRHPFTFEPADQTLRWERLDRYRDLNVGILKFTPLIYRGDDLHLVTKAVVTVYFPQARSVPLRTGHAEALLYAHSIVNWSEAKGWLQRPLQMRKSARQKSVSGQWYRFPVPGDGMYRITAATLQSAGIDIATLDPFALRMFTNPKGGRPMSHEIGAAVPENLIEVGFKVKGASDGVFHEGDEIVLYGRGPAGFDISEDNDVIYTQNPYANDNTYWLNIPDDPDLEGKRVTVEDVEAENPVSLDYGLAYRHDEEDIENPFESGLLWVGAGVPTGQTVAAVLTLHHPKQDIEATIDLSLFGGTSSDSEEYPVHFVKIYQRGTQQDTLLATKSWSGLSLRDFSTTLKGSLLRDGPNNYIVYENASSDPASKIFLDWTTVKYGQELVWEGLPFEFWAPSNVSVARFAVAQVNSDVNVWDVSDFAAPVEETIVLSGNTGFFEKLLSQNEQERFIVFNDKEIQEITDITYMENQLFTTLRTEIYPVDHIIIAPEEFAAAAEKLRSYRQNSIVAPLKAIYDEFSGGTQDPLAIRYFLKWTKDNWRNPADGSFPSYVLLLGDGDYDYRNLSQNSHNMVPTFQSGQTFTTSSDDRFTYLDGKVPEMAIGRFPAVSLADAENMVDKTIAYENNPDIGLWRRRITLIADDFARPSFGSIELTHTKNSEEVAAMIPKTLETRKIYMEEFPAVNDGSQYGVTKPGASEALFDLLEQGTALLNYIGHGSAYQWAQEGLLSSARGDLSSINTGAKLPVWVAATCSWGKYDRVEGSAMSEDIMRDAENGGIAIISTNGLITFSANRNFILNLFASFFPEQSVDDLTLGAIYSSIKDGSTGSEMFHLFGDPGLTIALPSDTVTVTDVSPDTLVALETGSYSGSVMADAPTQGEGYVIIYDADRTVSRIYEHEEYTEEMTYSLLGRTLFRGLLPYTGGLFQGEFILPKDINYATTDGQLTVFLHGSAGDDLWQGLGMKEGLILTGGTSNPVDSDGPLISFAYGERGVEWGDHIAESGQLTVILSDPLGINVTEEVGHTVRAWFNDDENSAKNITDRFVYDAGSYTSGSLDLSLSDLPKGESHITVEAWDNANNPNQKSISFHITADEELRLTNVFNYPNPFSDKTQFGFEVNREAEVTIKIFTLSGVLVKVIEPMESYYGYTHIDWNGRDDFEGDIANGAYLYQITAVPVDGGKKAKHIGKIAKYR
ncbi:MAG: type IX secretion system sortase PorU [Candidatus Marinimicrobia bacterium]|nr:type IX secretion system sortase PorU [Candidatus Neomarinimicrobiota bacterium]